MASDAHNNPFIRHLASSDKKVRDEAFASLKAFLGAQSQISELDLLKLWKGLFYCLWMQDKPEVQQKLSRNLASLVSTVRTSVAIPFVRAFFITMSQQWGQIEALRLDKYLYLIRQYVSASFNFLARNDWKTSLVVEWNKVVEEVPLETQDMKIPNGLRYHVLDVWVDELEKTEEDWEKEERRPLIEKIVAPVEKMAKDGKLKPLRAAAKECLADDRLRSWRGQEAEEQEASDQEDEEAEWGGFGDD